MAHPQQKGGYNMDRRRLFTAGVAAGLAATAASARANDDRAEDDIVGSWFGTVTATNPPLGQFNDLISFNAGGVVIESRRYFIPPPTPFGSLLETTGHGAWERTGRNTFKAFFRFLVQSAADGTPIGTDNIRLSLKLDRQAGTLTGSFESQIKNTTDAVLLTVTGDFSATSITV
jgi:hypothetical protein